MGALELSHKKKKKFYFNSPQNIHDGRPLSANVSCLGVVHQTWPDNGLNKHTSVGVGSQRSYLHAWTQLREDRATLNH